MEGYGQIFKNHEGLIAHKWIHYFAIYDRLFSPYRQKNRPLTMLEIGVGRGGSLEIWKKYLPEGSQIHGVDIDPKCSEIPFSGDIFFHLGSASDQNFMEKTFHDLEFDIILDDGSHLSSDVIKTFEIMFPKLKNGGIFIVEDLHASYWKSHGGGTRQKGTSIEYFKDFVEALNVDYIRPETNFFGFSAKDSGRQNYARMIESITFFDSICAITKFSSPKTGPFKWVITGRENLKGVNCWRNELEAMEETERIFGK